MKRRKPVYRRPLTKEEILEARISELEDEIFELEEQLEELDETDEDARDDINYDIRQLQEELDNCESALYHLEIEALTRDYYRSVL